MKGRKYGFLHTMIYCVGQLDNLTWLENISIHWKNLLTRCQKGQFSSRSNRYSGPSKQKYCYLSNSESLEAFTNLLFSRWLKVSQRWTRLQLLGDRNMFLVSKLELKRWLLLTKIHSRVRGLFPGREPFWAGYGNKAWDILAYKVLTVFFICLCVTVFAYFVLFFLQAIGIDPNRIFNVLSDSKVIHFCLKLWMWPNL